MANGSPDHVGREELSREYMLREEIGRGTWAIVRRAGSRLGGPVLAAKLLRPEFSGDRRVRDLFLREEAALRDLRHPSIVAVHDLVAERGTLALLMEYVDGENLRHHLAGHGGTLPVTEAIGIAAQAAAALAVAHAQGILHLDLKPENLLVVRGHQPTTVKIGDFGVAAVLLDAGQSILGGAPAYTAPELVRGGPPTAAADVYSLGVLLTEMLSGIRPRPGDAGPSGLTDSLQNLIRGCLAIDPRERPSARGLAAQLRAATSDLDVIAPGEPDHRERSRPASLGSRTLGLVSRSGTPPSPASPAAGRSKRRRAALVALAAGVLTAIVPIGLTLAAHASARPGSTPTATTAAPATSSPTPDPEPTGGGGELPFTVETLAAPAGPRATYAAHLPRGAGTLYLAVRDGEAIAYVCDGDRIEAWLRGTARNGALSLTSKKGGTLTGTAGDTRATGKISVRGLRVSSFTIAKVGKPSGLYKAAAKVRNADIVAGWIVLADGSQVGVVNAAGTPEPAPPLNTVTGIARINGTPVRATEIDVQTGTWFD